MSRQNDAILLGINPTAGTEPRLDGEDAPTIAKAARALTNALIPEAQHRGALNALARHVVDACGGTSGDYGKRVDEALERRARDLRAKLRDKLRREMSHDSTSKRAANARFAAENEHVEEVMRALDGVRVVAANVRDLLAYAPVPRTPLIHGIPPQVQRMDIPAAAEDAAELKRNAKLQEACEEDPTLDPQNLPRIVKNRLAAHKSNCFKATWNRLIRAELRKELVALRALALHATERACALINEQKGKVQLIPTGTPPTPSTSQSQSHAQLHPQSPPQLCTSYDSATPVAFLSPREIPFDPIVQPPALDSERLDNEITQTLDSNMNASALMLHTVPPYVPALSQGFKQEHVLEVCYSKQDGNDDSDRHAPINPTEMIMSTYSSIARPAA